MSCFCRSIDRKDISWHQCILHYFHFQKDNSKQMSKLCPTCTSVCDLCPNGLYWEQDSRFGLYDAALVQGICTTRTIPFLMYCLLSGIFILQSALLKYFAFDGIQICRNYPTISHKIMIYNHNYCLVDLLSLMALNMT